jgi:hypothetical protein
MTRPNATPSTYRPRPADARIAEAWLAGSTIEHIAEFANVSRSTIWRRLRNPGFAGFLAQRQRERLDRIQRHHESAAIVGLDALVDVAADPAAPHQSRVRAGEALVAAFRASRPLPQRVEATVAVGPHPDDRPPKDILTEAVARARQRLGYDPPAVVSGNGSIGDG